MIKRRERIKEEENERKKGMGGKLEKGGNGRLRRERREQRKMRERKEEKENERNKGTGAKK